MIGTIINIITVVIGSILGTTIGNRLNEKIRSTIISGLGLFTLGYGIISFSKSNNSLIHLGGLIIGVILGEWWHLEEGIYKLGQVVRDLSSKFIKSESNKFFVEGFVTASLLFCVGPMAILGSIQDGLTGDYSMLAIKAILDGFASMAFASTMGIGVIFSAIIVLLYQGGISLFAGVMSEVFTESMITEMTAVGGIILIGISFSSLLTIKKIRIGSFLPALITTPIIVWILTKFAINF